MEGVPQPGLPAMMNARTQRKQQQKGSAMSAMYPLAIVDTTSITSLVRMTLYHRSISVCHTKIETNEGVAALGGNARNVAAENPVTQLVSDIPGVRTATAVQDVTSK
jgi:osmotically-inducible protein OsmY